ncbi:MAG TPA: hypothetical protein VF543_03525 [Pyrinomonadaceae bacterium]
MAEDIILLVVSQAPPLLHWSKVGSDLVVLAERTLEDEAPASETRTASRPDFERPPLVWTSH